MGHDADIHLPHVPGHELAGTVAAVGFGVRRWKVGDRVTTPFCLGCGRCGKLLDADELRHLPDGGLRDHGRDRDEDL